MDGIRIETWNIKTEDLEQRIREASPDVRIDVENAITRTEVGPVWVQITLSVLSSDLAQLILQLIVDWAKETNVLTRVLDHKGHVIREVRVRSK
jgi:hypothetical protein